MNIFEQEICHITSKALNKFGVDEKWEPLMLNKFVEHPPHSEMGDYAFPCYNFSKIFKISPTKIAEVLVNKIKVLIISNNYISSAEAVGPYINFRISTVAMAEYILPRIFSGMYFKESSKNLLEKVMIEYSQPNTHKGFHVGHLRNVALGDSLSRIFKYNGYNVVGVNYIGDVGAHIAKCLWYYLNYNEESPPENFRGEWLGELYFRAVKKLDEASEIQKKKYQDEISAILKKLEKKDNKLINEWEITREWSLKDFNEIYNWLDVKFDHIFYESEVDEEGKRIVLEGLQKGIFIRSEGAIGINLEDEDLGFFMLLKSDGNTLYSTKDLALAQLKFEKFGVERSIYVVGSEQKLPKRQRTILITHKLVATHYILMKSH